MVNEMNKREVVHSRKLKDGRTLECKLACDHTGKHYPDLYIDKKRVPKRVPFSITTIEFLKRYEDKRPYELALTNGATHVLGSVLLFQNDVDAISKACLDADEKKTARERDIIENSDVVLIQARSSSFPKTENEYFSMDGEYTKHKQSGQFIGYRYRTMKGTEAEICLYQHEQEIGVPVDSETAERYKKFLRDSGLLNKTALQNKEDREYKRQMDTAKANDAKRRERLGISDLTAAEVQEKARIYDLIQNEGEEGFNPYR